jgi:hypothetical protein
MGASDTEAHQSEIDKRTAQNKARELAQQAASGQLTETSPRLKE